MRKLSVLTLMTAAMVIIFMVGCGGDEAASPNNPVIEEKDPAPPLGLHGDTYRNQRYVFKVSNLPVDDWTVKEIGSLSTRESFKRWEESFGRGARFNVHESLLLMQPTEDNFQDTTTEAFDNQMPFIFVWVEKQTATEEKSPEDFAEGLLRIMRLIYIPGSFEVTSQGDIVSKDRVSGYALSLTFWDGDKQKESFFMRPRGNTRFVYRFYFWSPGDRYDEVAPVYDGIVASLEFNTL